MFVVSRAKGGPNLRQYAEAIIEKASVKQWPKLFQNCRSTRETELMQVHSARVVLSWIGHAAAVARNPSLRTTDFIRAAETPAQIPARAAPGRGTRER